MIKKWFVISVFLLSQVTHAQCPEDIQAIEKGQVANCTGTLISPDATKKFDDALQDLEYYEDLTDRLYKRQDLTNKEIETLDKRLQLYMEQSEVLAKEVYKKEREDKWQKAIYFGLGVIATGIAVSGAKRL